MQIDQDVLKGDAAVGFLTVDAYVFFDHAVKSDEKAGLGGES